MMKIDTMKQKTICHEAAPSLNPQSSILNPFFTILFLLFSLFFFSSATAKTISMNFYDMPVKNAVEWLAKFQDSNVIISPEVKGKISLHLKDVDSKEAMKILLDSQSLMQRQEGNILYIEPLNSAAQNEALKNEAKNLEPLQINLIHLRYAKAKNIETLLKNKNETLLSKQGSVSIDERTNSVIIRDTATEVEETEKFIREIDVAVPQVLIEARIVSVDDDYEKDLGIKFGVNGTHSIPLLGQGSNLQMDLPSSENSSVGDLAFLALKKGIFIDMELAALQTEGHAEIISNPRLVTENQESAEIQAGEEVPYQSSAATTGATKTSFKKAVLSLEVTPQITSDRKIILSLNVHQDKPSSALVNGVPVISTRQITTHVLADDNQTIVLGGIFEKSKINGVDRVPFLSDLPGLGVLFRHNKTITHRRELLIFVTPKIEREG